MKRETDDLQRIIDLLTEYKRLARFEPATEGIDNTAALKAYPAIWQPGGETVHRLAARIAMEYADKQFKAIPTAANKRKLAAAVKAFRKSISGELEKARRFKEKHKRRLAILAELDTLYISNEVLNRDRREMKTPVFVSRQCICGTWFIPRCKAQTSCGKKSSSCRVKRHRRK